MTDSNPFDKERAKTFTKRVLSDIAGAVAMNFCVIGDRLALFKDLAINGPADSVTFANRNQVNERYAREWLEGLAAAGYLEFDPDTARFTLPAEHTRPLAEDSHPLFQGNLRNLLTYGLGPIDELIDAFKNGGGVEQSSFAPEFYATMQCSSGVRYENFLLQTWLPEMPDVVAMLERGVDVADVGCGQGTALTLMAKAFPNSTFWGYDAFAPQIESAIKNAEARGIGSNASFEVLDGSG